MKALLKTLVAVLLLCGAGNALAIEGEMIVHHDGYTTAIPMNQVSHIAWNPMNQGIEIAAAQTYVYPLSSLEKITFEHLADVPEGRPGIPEAFSLGHAYPNPFNAAVTLPISLASSGRVELSLVNLLGRRVLHRTVVLTAGRHRLTLDARQGTLAGVSSGVYLLRVQAQGSVRSQKLILLK